MISVFSTGEGMSFLGIVKEDTLPTTWEKLKVSKVHMFFEPRENCCQQNIQYWPVRMFFHHENAPVHSYTVEVWKMMELVF